MYFAAITGPFIRRRHGFAVRNSGGLILHERIDMGESNKVSAPLSGQRYRDNEPPPIPAEVAEPSHQHGQSRRACVVRES